MIAFLRGIVAEKTGQKAFIDVQGVGYDVNMSLTSLSSLPPVGEEALVYTYLHVREDGIVLFGFSTKEEKALFEKLIGVSGVGPKVALAALSAYRCSDLAAAIASQDVARVSKVPGIGKKTASRIILELKGSLELAPEAQMSLTESGSETISDVANGVREALLSMGFTSAESDLAMKGAPESADETALLHYALKRLGSV